MTVPLLLPPYNDWPAVPACTEADSGLFFPADGHRFDAAKAICAGCPVINECAGWALDHPGGAAYGVWGGMTPDERDRLVRRRRRRRGR